jgi:hypothetical protein
MLFGMPPMPRTWSPSDNWFRGPVLNSEQCETRSKSREIRPNEFELTRRNANHGGCRGQWRGNAARAISKTLRAQDDSNVRQLVP